MSITTLYRMFAEDGRLLYVGISSRAAARWEQHRHDKPWWSEIARISVEHFPTRDKALAAELVAIRGEQPQHNVAGAVHSAVVQPVVLRDLRGAKWRDLVALEPRLLELQAQIRVPLHGCSDEPLCSWYGYHSDGWRSLKDRVCSLIGWSRGEGWAWHDTPLETEVPVVRRGHWEWFGEAGPHCHCGHHEDEHEDRGVCTVCGDEELGCLSYEQDNHWPGVQQAFVGGEGDPEEVIGMEPRWYTAAELCALPDPEGRAEFEAAERAAGRGELFREHAYDVAYDTLYDALPWGKRRSA